MRAEIRMGGLLLFAACHWRHGMWKWAPFWLSVTRIRAADGHTLGFTSLIVGCEFAILRLAA